MDAPLARAFLSRWILDQVRDDGEGHELFPPFNIIVQQVAAEQTVKSIYADD